MKLRLIIQSGSLTGQEFQLETGRTHQIRVHMKHIDHILFNDATFVRSSESYNNRKNIIILQYNN